MSSARSGDSIDRGAGYPRNDNVGHDADQALPGFFRPPGIVRGHDQIRNVTLQKRVGRTGWLAFQDVDAGAGDLAAPQCAGERLRIDDGTPGGIDEKGVRFHQGEFPFSDQVPRPGGQRAMYGYHVAQLEKVIESDTACRRFRTLAAGNDNLHSECPGDVGGPLAERSVADHSENLALCLDNSMIQQAEHVIARPCSRPDILDIAVLPRQQVEHEADRMLDHGRGGILAHVADRDVPGRAGGQVDIVRARCRDQHQPECGRALDRLPVDYDLVGDGDLHAAYPLGY